MGHAGERRDVGHCTGVVNAEGGQRGHSGDFCDIVLSQVPRGEVEERWHRAEHGQVVAEVLVVGSDLECRQFWQSAQGLEHGEVEGFPFLPGHVTFGLAHVVCEVGRLKIDRMLQSNEGANAAGAGTLADEGGEAGKRCGTDGCIRREAQFRADARRKVRVRERDDVVGACGCGNRPCQYCQRRERPRASHQSPQSHVPRPFIPWRPRRAAE